MGEGHGPFFAPQVRHPQDALAAHHGEAVPDAEPFELSFARGGKRSGKRAGLQGGEVVVGVGGNELPGSNPVQHHLIHRQRLGQELPQAPEEKLGIGNPHRLFGKGGQRLPGRQPLPVLQPLDGCQKRPAHRHRQAHQRHSGGSRQNRTELAQAKTHLGEPQVEEGKGHPSEDHRHASGQHLAQHVLQVPKPELQKRGGHAQRHQRQRQKRKPA
ncbi:hypothetical protein HRbin09_01475 [bacterium HR09]|nr:hypothetical protein HRbin09_01475 [bacterium HR09]